MGSTKVLPIFLFLVEQITQTSDRPAMMARDRLGMEQTAQHTFLHALGHRPARTGSFCGNGSGEIVIAFTTANRVPHYSEKALLPMTLLHDDAINPLFRAVAECVEESVLSSLLHAETVTGNHGQTFRSLTELLKNRA